MRSSQLLDPVANRMHDALAAQSPGISCRAHRGSSDDIELEKPFGRPRRLPPTRCTVVPFVRLGHPSSAHPSVTCARTIPSPLRPERRTSRRRSRRSHRPTRPGPRRLRTARSPCRSQRGAPAQVRARRVGRQVRRAPGRRHRPAGRSAPAGRQDRRAHARQRAPADRWVLAGLGLPALRWDLEGPLDLAARAPVRCIPRLRASRCDRDAQQLSHRRPPAA